MNLFEPKRMNKKIILASACLLIVAVLFEISNIDIIVQDVLYNFELKQWLLDRDNKIARIIFYDGIKVVFVVFVFLLLFGLLLFWKARFIQAYKQGLVIVLLSVCLVPLVVGGLKAVTNVPCPRDIAHYDGIYPYVTVLTTYPEDFRQTDKIRCYPAGHASGGFALMSLMFLFRKRRDKVIALSFALGVGWITGGYKMLIGDHFLSHTVVTMMLAWLIILLVAKYVNKAFDLYKGWSAD